MKTELKHKIIAFSFGLCAGGFFYIKHVLAFLHNRLPAYDYGIYQKALMDISNGISLNPYIPYRGLTIFADHFDPIQYLVAPFVFIFGTSNYFILSLDILCYLFLIGLMIKREDDKKNLVMWMFILIFSRGLLSAIDYPIHPTTWSIIPLFFLFESFFKNRFKQMIFWGSFLCLFKENYPFSLLGLGIYFSFRKELKKSLISFGVGIFWIFIVFKLRPILIGDVFSYAPRAETKTLMSLISNFNFLDVFKTFLPLLIPFAILLKNKKYDFWEIIGFLGLYSPIFLTHLIVGKSHYHYGAVLGLPLICLVYFKREDIPKLIDRKFCFLICLISVVVGFNMYKKNIKAYMDYFGNKAMTEIRSSNKRIEHELVKIRQLGGKPIIFANEGIITRHQKPGDYFTERSGFIKKPEERYDYYILSKNNIDEIYPYTREEVDRMISCFRSVSEIVFENEYYIFGKGDLPRRCSM